jgi:hypothetical protein
MSAISTWMPAAVATHMAAAAAHVATAGVLGERARRHHGRYRERPKEHRDLTNQFRTFHNATKVR